MRSRFVSTGPEGILYARPIVAVAVLALASLAAAQQPATGSALSSEPVPAVNAPLAIGAGTSATTGGSDPVRAVPRLAPLAEPMDASVAPSPASRRSPESGAPPTTVPPAERIPLGPPPTLGGPGASAAVAGTASAATDEGSGWLPSFLDPRRSAMARTLGSLALVLALAWVVLSLMRRTTGPLAGGRRPSGVMQVLARYPVGRGQSVLLLQVGRRVLCVHQAAGVMRTLADISDRDEVADLVARVESPSSSAFVALLNGATGRIDRSAPVAVSASRARPVRASDAPMVETIDLTRSRAGLSRLLAGRQTR
ncbi:MAG: flagellar biosynthetic protein FliO [Phycisphaerales bacterium]|nr:flagellar biosynthetic protein FliO [Phycisphaerales bacterium]